MEALRAGGCITSVVFRYEFCNSYCRTVFISLGSYFKVGDINGDIQRKIRYSLKKRENGSSSGLI